MKQHRWSKLLMYITLLSLLVPFMWLNPNRIQASDYTSTLLKGIVENNSTTILLRTCGTGANHQFRSEKPGVWISQIWTKTPVNGCSPDTTVYWRVVVDAVPGETFNIYSSVTDGVLDESNLMSRARKDTCTVTGVGVINCTRQSVSHPGSDIQGLTDNQVVSGVLQFGGWYADLASLSGPGIDSIHVHLIGNGNDYFTGAATYGLSRPEVANAYGDSRFTNTGYTHSIDTKNYPNGTYFLRVAGHSTVDNNWSWSQRTITIDNSNIPPNQPNLVDPANGSIQTSRTFTLSWSDAGDPDNGPRSYRDFEVDIWKSDNSWRSHYNWQTGTQWTVTVPNDGTYTWQVRAGDGRGASSWATRTVIVNAAGTARHDETRIRGAAEWSGTTIFAKICGQGTNYRLRSERLNPNPQLLGDWSYGALNGCTNEYRPVINAVPGEQFRIYTTVSNGSLSLNDFLANARRQSCTIMAVGTVVCNLGDTPPPYNQPPQPTNPLLLDVRYVDQVYVQRYPEGGYWNHCGPSSVAMLLNYEGKEPRDVLYNRQATLDLVPQVKRPGDGRAHWDLIQNTIRNKGLQITYGAGMSADAIRTSIAQGHPIVMGFGIGHIMIINGVTADGKFVVNDPMGGYKWWTVPWSSNANRNDAPWTPPFATPRTKGFKTEYTYQELVNIGLGNYVRVVGPRPTVSSSLSAGTMALAQKNTTSDPWVLTGDGIEVAFPQTATTLNITHTSLITPTQSVSDTSSVVSAFTLNAVDTNGTNATQYGEPFSMTINLDAGVIDSLGNVQGETIAEGEPPTNIAPTMAATKPIVVLKRWNTNTSNWEKVAATVDLNSYRITAQTEQFGEYAVFIEQQNTVFVPFVSR